MAGAREDFWSRRKAAVGAEAAAEAATARSADEARTREALALAQADKTDAEILGALELQDPDLMQLGDDFAAFMHSAVPEHLRRKALRRLWRSNPVLANLDGLVDHGDDFTDAATVLPGMKTAYQVGRGMVRHVLALAEAEAAAVSRTEAPDAAAVAIPQADVAAMPAAETPAEPVSAVRPAAPRDDLPATPPRRHMRFAIAD